MFSLPPIPPFEGLHPLVVHFPVAMLLTAWLPMIIGLFINLINKNNQHTKHWWIATMLWLGIGVTGTMAAVITGEAAADIAVITTDAAKTLLEQHEKTGELTRTIFIITLLLALTTFLMKFVWSAKKPFIITASILTTLTYAAGTLLLINTAHQGGLLVHEHAILAPIGSN